MRRFVTTFICLILCLSISNCYSRDKEISITFFEDQVDITEHAEFIKVIRNVRITDLVLQKTHKYPDNTSGIIKIPSNSYSGDIMLQFTDDKKREYFYLIPFFKYKVRVSLNNYFNYDCVSYIRYNGCDAFFIEDQYGVSCEKFNFILIDYCHNSPIIISPGILAYHKYEDYSIHIDSITSSNLIPIQQPCDYNNICKDCNIPATITNIEDFLKANFLHGHFKWRPAGKFTIIFMVSCNGKIIGKNILKNDTNVNSSRILSFFTDEIDFIPAMHNGEYIDSYKEFCFRLKGKRVQTSNN